MAEFLVELGCEELPPTTLSVLSEAFMKGVSAGLKASKLSFASISPFATPRRLALIVHELADSTPIDTETVWGPPAKIAFDENGEPSKAALAFAAKNNIEPGDLATANDGKADKLMLEKTVGGEAVTQLLPGIIEAALSALPIAKRMRWGDSRIEFVRPVHWLIMLLDEQVVETSVLGLTAGQQTCGHRVYHREPVTIKHPSDYVSTLESLNVIASFSTRRAMVKDQVAVAGASVAATAVIDDALLDEVTGLVEWPQALLGRFEERFLSVPSEALISSMKSHQKYFHLVNNQQQLQPYFITVANIHSKDAALVIDGNERVIRPRLADAAFFFETDKKTPLIEHRERLKTVVFQKQLGTIFDKTERVARLAVSIANKLNINSDAVKRAAELAKADLVTEMVGEFADLQGIAGRYYAEHDGEAPEVALAVSEHYLPRFASDALPTGEIGAVVAMADRLDTLVGIFGVGQQPTGSKDPFALRRASVALLRLLIEQERDLDLADLLTLAFDNFESLPKGREIIGLCQDYILERLRSWFEDQGIVTTVYQAVINTGSSHPLDIARRVRAVNHFKAQPEAQNLAAANKRVANILAKNANDNRPSLNASLLAEPAELALAASLVDQQKALEPLVANSDYQSVLMSLCQIREVVDNFFDDVMVMCDDTDLRNNRLALLSDLRQQFLQVADIATLSVSKT